MDAETIRAITFGFALVVIVAYGIFVAWRVRVHRQRREVEEGRRANSDTLSSDAMLRPTTAPPSVDDEDAPVPERQQTRPAAEAAPTSEPEPATVDAARPTTVLDAVQGISLPHDLVPHPDATPRPGAMDRVALTGTMISEENLKEGLEGALGALGYEITWADELGMARRGEAELRVDVFTSPRSTLIDGVPAFPLAAEGAVVVDFWIPKAD